MNTKHTPGPWQSIVPPSSCLAHRFITTDRDSTHNPVLAEVGGRMASDDEVSIFESVANARLIAAAPELLQEVHDLAAYLRYHFKDNPRHVNRARLAEMIVSKATGNA